MDALGSTALATVSYGEYPQIITVDEAMTVVEGITHSATVTVEEVVTVVEDITHNVTIEFEEQVAVSDRTRALDSTGMDITAWRREDKDMGSSDWNKVDKLY